MQNVILRPAVKVNPKRRESYWGLSNVNFDVTGHLFCIRQMLGKNEDTMEKASAPYRLQESLRFS